KEHISSNQKGILLKTISDLFHFKQKPNYNAIYFLYHIMSDNELIAVIPKIDNPIVLDLICETAFQEKNENVILALLDSPHFDPNFTNYEPNLFRAAKSLNSMIYPFLAHPSINLDITGPREQLLEEAVLWRIPEHPWTETLLLSKMHDSDCYVRMFEVSYRAYKKSVTRLQTSFSCTIDQHHAFKKNFLLLVNNINQNILSHMNQDNYTVIFEIFKYLKLNINEFQSDPNVIYAIRCFLDQGAKLNLIVPNQELTYLAYCEKYLPITLEQINRIQFEYAHASRWQKLLDMGALTNDVDLYIYALVYQNPQLIVENQTLKTLFCQILSQENRPHIDLIWEAYHNNVAQHPLTYVIENFLSKKPSKLTQHNAPETNIMEDPLSFTIGYCHYLGKDVLFILDNNLDERKSLLTTKLYQSEIKPYLLPPSINHSLFSQLCQNKNVSDLGQHRFDQQYGLMTQPQGRKG
ncbi:MAG: hypothetical protein P8L77_00430, partial [Gammaproteobacteria bacterium]|nr:hypothetical protein [Gammaproteobacteria bacterium]